MKTRLDVKKTYKLFIGGKFPRSESGRYLPVKSPNGEHLDNVAHASRKDFQDAVVGPVTYDLVSLLRDCYVAWPSERVIGWLRRYHRQAAAAGLPVGNLAEFGRSFDLAGVQRHLKAIGIFARLWHRDGKPGYLGDIPRVLRYVDEVACEYPELAPLRRLVEHDVLPRLPA